MQIVSKNRKTHYRQQSYTAKHEHRRLHALQHHQYLISLQKNKSLYPRYDVFSENNHNNLIVHVRQDPRQELKPKKNSFLVAKLQQKIKNSSQDIIKEGRTKSKFYVRDVTSRTQQITSAQRNVGSQEQKPNLTNMVVYQQEEDKALSMEQKLRLLYLGSRNYSKNRHNMTLDRDFHSHY